MAALTGNSISSTYTSLLKVGDNGTLAAALQSISDGAGNTTGLSMNTGGDLTATGTVTANAFAGPLTGNVTGDLTGTASLASNLTGTPNISVGTISASGTITGNLTGDVTGNVTGNVTGSSGSTTGNAATATALQTARTIAGVSFDGTANISLDTSNITEDASYLYYTAERVDDQVDTLLQAGTGITKTYDDTAGTLTIANSAPDQTVALTGGTGITTSGTYPNFTITNSAPDQTVALSAGTGINITGTYPSFTIANTGSGIGLTDLSAVDGGGLGSFTYNNGTGAFTYTGPSDNDVRTLISVTDSGGDGSLAYNNATGVITYTGPSSSEVQAHITKTYVDSLNIAASTADTLATARTINGVSFNGSANISFDTDSVSEGSSNLYYTAERVDDQVNTLVVAGTGISKTYDDAAGTLTIANTSPDQTVALTAGSNVSISGTYPSFTIAATDTQTDSFKTIAVSGQNNIVADSATDTLTIAAGSNVTLTTNDSTDTLTIAATDTNTTYSAGTGLALAGTTFSLDSGLNNLTDVNISTPAAGHLLIYDNSNSYFENATLTAGSNVSITNGDGSITIAATDTQTDSFKTIAVAGQNNVVADSATDTLTLTGGSNVTITTNDSTDTITFASTDTTYTAGTGLSLSSTTFSLDSGLNNLTDVNLTSPAAGHLMIYDNTNSYFENATLTAGSNVTITNADGSITVAATDTNTTYTAGSGLTLSGTEFSLTNNSVTIGGTAVALGASLTATSSSLTIGGNGSTGGVTIDDGSIQIRTGTGNVAEMRFYCESSNAHYQTLKAAPHSAASSAVLVLPTASGNLVGTGDTGSVATAMIADDAISYAKLGAEYTTSAAISASDVDWSSAAVHTKTLGANTTLTFSNVSTGMTVDLVISGNYTLTLPTSVKEITGTYDGTVANLIQIVSTNGSTEQWATISQEA